MPPNDDNPAQPVTMQNMPLPETFAAGKSQYDVDKCPKWIKRFERYRVATGLSPKPDTEQVGTLLYAMGECADDILGTLTNINETKATYQEVKDALDTYFGVSRNVIVERARFNRRVQKPGENVNTFIQDLYQIAEYCEYGILKDDLIRDRIVVGVIDEALSDWLQMKSDLKLAEAVQMTRQAEARKDNREIVRGDTKSLHSTSSVDSVTRKHQPRQRKNTPKKPPSQATSTTAKHANTCKWCGHEQHFRRVCPAREAVCGKCKKVGHFQTVCQAKTIQEVVTFDTENPDPETLYLDEVKNDPNFWKVNLDVHGHSTLFKIDTGAAVSVLSDQLPWIQEVQLEPSDRVLRGPGDTLLTFEV